MTHLLICGLLISGCGCRQATTIEFPPEAAQAAGFALMHAAWSISDVPEVLLPLALTQKHREKKLIRFDSETYIQDAVIKGLTELTKDEKTLDYWVLVFDTYEHKGNLKTEC